MLVGLLPFLALGGCGGSPAGQPTTSLSGTLSLFNVLGVEDAADHLPLANIEPPRFDIANHFVPGEIIIRFHDPSSLAAAQVLTIQGVSLQSIRPLAISETALYRADVDKATTLRLIDTLNARPDVKFAEPNFIWQAQQTPNDPLFSDQWNHLSIGLPTAWDLTTGSSDIVVAVGDTGILFRAGSPSASHPDLSAARMLRGYDFISSPLNSNDGDGRDPDPYDEGGDLVGGGSSYHGTHVTGILGAATNNGLGVAGVDWAAKILPIRMLGVGGGTMVDIIEGTLWAAGFEIPGIENNANPAHVINLSLGGQQACPSTAQAAFKQIADDSLNNTIVVIAAGNAGISAGEFTPGNCGNVLTIGATGPDGTRPSYSNYGPRIDLMAPGGANAVQGNGILSLARFANWGYGYSSGTSMAAPHVAGVVALMKSIDPDLNLSAVRTVLTETATPMNAAACNRATATDCGAGILNAGAAITMLATSGVPGGLQFDPNPLFFGANLSQISVELSNLSGASLEWSIVGYQEVDYPGDLLDPDELFMVSKIAGTLAANASETITVTLDRNQLTAAGSYFSELVFEVDGSPRMLLTRFDHAPSVAQPTGRTTVVGIVIGESGSDQRSSRAYNQFQSTFQIPSPIVGQNIVVAWVDENNNGSVDDGDYLGFVEGIQVVAGENRSGVNIVLFPAASVGSSPIPVAPLLDLDVLFSPTP
jgi:serine protease